MLHILLTTIISYNPRILDINREYHNTFIYKDKSLFVLAAIYHCYSGKIMYNWRCKEIFTDYIYSKYSRSKYPLPKNY